MTRDYKKILFTTDLSQQSKEVFNDAAALAVKSNASIIILHIIEDESSRTKDLIVDMIGSEAYDKVVEDNENHARTILLGKQKQVPIIKETLEKLGETAANSQNVPSLIEGVVIRMGKTVDEILQIAEEAGCDLIVMGNHQKTMLTRTVIGRTVKGVLAKAKIPVFLVPIDI